MEELNSIIQNFIADFEIKDFSEFNLLSNLINIVDKYKKPLKKVNAKHSVKLNKSFKYSYQFFKAIDQKYADYLTNIKENDVFHFEDDKNGLPYSTFENGKSYIYMPLQYNINDTYAITHETIHDMSVTSEEVTETRLLFCEVFSLLGELLQQDFLKKTTKPKEYSLNKISMIHSLYQYNINIFFELDLIKAYLDNGYINQIKIIDILSNYKGDDLITISNHISYILELGELSYGFDQRYIIGFLIACYMHDRILNDPKKINEFIELNDNINYFEIFEVLDYLNLQYEEFEILNLTPNSYKKLEKSYINELKRR